MCSLSDSIPTKFTIIHPPIHTRQLSLASGPGLKMAFFPSSQSGSCFCEVSVSVPELMI